MSNVEKVLEEPAISVEKGSGPIINGEAVVQTIGTRIGRYRWVICALLFFAATINYIDRQVIGLLKDKLQADIGWDEIDYSWIVVAFQAAYALGLLFIGRVIDWLGTRKGLSLAMVFWSLAAMAHALVSSVIGFGAVRFLLGLGESGSFPASIKTVAEWFPKKERALATGVFNSGTNVGALITPLAVPLIYKTFGWRAAFLCTGAIGFVWLIFWLIFYRRPEEHPRLSKAELAYIRSEPPEPTTKIAWARLIPHRQTWAFAAGKFLTDPIWWVYLFWIPDFLHKTHGLNIENFGLPLVVIYWIASIGSIGGGYLSSPMIRAGWTPNRARKTAMLICAVCVLPIVFASIVKSLWLAVILVGIAAAAHQGWSANIFTIASDTFPRRAVASVVGIGGMAGAVGGMLISPIVGLILQRTGSYFPIFVIAGSVYLIALLVIHLLSPRLEPANIGD